MKALGVRDLTYRMAFLACHIEPTTARMGMEGMNTSDEDIPMEKVMDSITPDQWKRISEMSTDPQLYQNLIQSMFPTIYGKLRFERPLNTCLFLFNIPW